MMHIRHGHNQNIEFAQAMSGNKPILTLSLPPNQPPSHADDECMSDHLSNNAFGYFFYTEMPLGAYRF
jgi:hypothetical protein